MQLADEVRWLSHIGGDPRIFSLQAYLMIKRANRDSHKSETRITSTNESNESVTDLTQCNLSVPGLNKNSGVS